MTERLAGRCMLAALLWLLGACSGDDRPTELVVQRFFGACEAEYGTVTDPAEAEGECGIMTAIINRFEAQNPDIRVVENVVAWPGYDPLTAQLAANDAPDLVTMHGSVISDYQARGLLLPMRGELAKAGIDLSDLTEAARRAVEIDGELWGLPLDTWAPLWHVNMNLFREAGLVRNGEPLLPGSPEELYAHAAQFLERTGKPYFVQAIVNEYAAFARNFYTFVMQQNGTLYRAGPRANFRTPEAAQAIQLFRTVYERGFTTQHMDYSAAVAGFLQGRGGVFLVGTWMVGTFESASRQPAGALSSGYRVLPYPRLFARDVSYADGHNWVMPVDPQRSTAEQAAARRFLAFFATQNFQWSRTGHLPVFAHIIASDRWRALPHRSGLATLAGTAEPLPKTVRRQFPIETIVGQEAGAAVTGAKPVIDALADMQRRVNDILENL